MVPARKESKRAGSICWDRKVRSLPKPDESKPDKSKPRETKPVEAGPTGEITVETTPHESKPAETKAAESKPVNLMLNVSKPGGSKL